MADINTPDETGELSRQEYWRGYRQNFYPHHLLSGIMYLATRFRFAPWKNWQIRWFIQRYQVDMDATIHQHPSDYPHFNTFFTRALRPGVRPIDTDANTIVSPADGVISQYGDVDQGRVLQAKGQRYSVQEFLGGDVERAATFNDGKYLTVYLSPKDYHRVHIPYGGTLCETVYIPGRLFSVNPTTTRVIPNLFARNERVVSIYDTDMGKMAVVLIGAVFVGGIEMCWPYGPAKKLGQTWCVSAATPVPVTPVKGDEIGRFNMGSTVVVLFENPRMVWSENVAANAPIEMGKVLARLN